MRNTLFHLEELIKDRNPVMLAHYYQDPDIQDVADYMGETVKIVITEKTLSLCIQDDGFYITNIPKCN